mgnify:CR=1 FL=1
MKKEESNEKKKLVGEGNSGTIYQIEGNMAKKFLKIRNSLKQNYKFSRKQKGLKMLLR